MIIDLSYIWPPYYDELGNVQASPTTVAYQRGEYTPTPEEAEAISVLETTAAWMELRARRNALLTQSDWTQLPDAPHNPAWAVYRQALRDLPQNTVDPSSVVWPESP